MNKIEELEKKIKTIELLLEKIITILERYEYSISNLLSSLKQQEKVIKILEEKIENKDKLNYIG